MKVLLLGDSIRRQSEKYVIQNLNDGIELSAPDDNCRSSEKVKNNLSLWLNKQQYDLIHINCGLHDIRYDPDSNGQPLATKAQYIDNLETIFTQLKKLNCTIIWATSTPFNEENHNRLKESKRYLRDLIDYNAASVELAVNYGFKINDLYAKVLKQDNHIMTQSDGVHFDEPGRQRIGELVATVINAEYTKRFAK